MLHGTSKPKGLPEPDPAHPGPGNVLGASVRPRTNQVKNKSPLSKHSTILKASGMHITSPLEWKSVSYD
jgi:hypothetical protein